MPHNHHDDAITLLKAASRRCPGPDRDGHQEIPLLDLAADLGWPPERAMAALDVLCRLGNDRVDTGLGDPGVTSRSEVRPPPRRPRPPVVGCRSPPGDVLVDLLHGAGPELVDVDELGGAVAVGHRPPAPPADR